MNILFKTQVLDYILIFRLSNKQLVDTYKNKFKKITLVLCFTYLPLNPKKVAYLQYTRGKMKFHFKLTSACVNRKISYYDVLKSPVKILQNMYASLLVVHLVTRLKMSYYCLFVPIFCNK